MEARWTYYILRYSRKWASIKNSYLTPAKEVIYRFTNTDAPVVETIDLEISLGEYRAPRTSLWLISVPHSMEYWAGRVSTGSKQYHHLSINASDI